MYEACRQQRFIKLRHVTGNIDSSLVSIQI